MASRSTILMSDKQQNIQGYLPFPEEGRGETPSASGKGAESPMAERVNESQASTAFVMERVCQRDNLKRALKQVMDNRGSPGVDGMTVKELPGYLKRRWSAIRDQLLGGTYKPLPVKRVEIPKPGGGIRLLGIPTVLDRFIQQAVLGVLQPLWDPTFSEHSYGFRPGRSAHQAIAAAQQYVCNGFVYVVDIDLEKFFDRVNHDILMSRIARRIGDKRLLKLIRAFLESGVIIGGLFSRTEEGTPQGGPISPLLSNLMLDVLDRELEKRGHKFVRYADDSNIYVRSERAGLRVMESVERFLTRKLKLKINRKKSAVARANKRKFLSFSFTYHKEARRSIAPQAIQRFRKRVRGLTRRNRGLSIEQVVEGLRIYLSGWLNYFGFCETPSVLRDLDSWIRRRLRSIIWKQWKRPRTRYRKLRNRGVNEMLAKLTVKSSKGPWRVAASPAVCIAFPNAFFDSLGLPRLRPAKNA